MTKEKFVERRREHRLPYEEKMIFTDGEKAMTGYAVNISRGGMFMKTLDPFPIDTVGHLAFCLPTHPQSFCMKAKIAHLVFDRQRCEVECGMGIMLLELSEAHKSILNLHILNEQKNYLELKRILAPANPDSAQLAMALKRMPQLAKLDLLALRYRVNRICTIFEPPPQIIDEDAA